MISLHLDRERYFAHEVQYLANIARNQYELAKSIKSFIEEQLIKDGNSHFLNDVINCTLSEVNWQELAEGYVQQNGTVFNQEALQGDSNDDR